MPFIHQFVEVPVVTVKESDEGRKYLTPNGDLYESVTTFISRNWDKSFLFRWKKRVGETHAASEALRAADRGKILHKLSEYYLLNDIENYKININKSLTDKMFFLKIKPILDKINNIRLIEKSLYSDQLKLAGTPDIIAEFDNVLSTIDLKGSTRDKLEEYITTYWIQAAIYSRMYGELFGAMPEQSVIIMAIEDNPAPTVFIEPTIKGQIRLNEFLSDPVAFQKRLEIAKKVRRSKNV